MTDGTYSGGRVCRQYQVDVFYQRGYNARFDPFAQKHGSVCRGGLECSWSDAESLLRPVQSQTLHKARAIALSGFWRASTNKRGHEKLYSLNKNAQFAMRVCHALGRVPRAGLMAQLMMFLLFSTGHALQNTVDPSNALFQSQDVFVNATELHKEHAKGQQQTEDLLGSLEGNTLAGASTSETDLQRPDNTIALSLEIISALLFLVGLSQHDSRRYITATTLFLLAFGVSVMSRYAQALLLHEHTLLTTQLNVFSGLIFRNILVFFNAREARVRSGAVALCIWAAFDIAATIVMYFECEKRGFSTTDPRAHHLSPLVWFYGHQALSIATQNATSAFLLFLYLTMYTRGQKRATDALSPPEYPGLGGPFEDVSPPYMLGGARDWIAGDTASRVVAWVGIALAAPFAWAGVNNVMLCVEGLLQYQGAWAGKVCTF